MYKVISTVLLLTIVIHYTYGQKPSNARLVGGPCEGCEAVFEYGNRQLAPMDTLPDYFLEKGRKIKITGTIYQTDGRTPAEGVVLYVYHTNQKGIYEAKADAEGWGTRHGYIRGWIKTDKEGKYTFYTLQPGTYPDKSKPAHIHPVILEPDGRYYWVDSFYFIGDPLLGNDQSQAQRGGFSGVMSLEQEDEIWVGKRDFMLGKNIEPYE